MSKADRERIARFNRLASGGLAEMAKTIRQLPAADELDDEDVHLAIVCGCLRLAACEVAAMPEAEIAPFLEFLRKQFVVLRCLERGSVVGAYSERLQ